MVEDRVGEVLAQRQTLESGAAAGVALSVFLHSAAAVIIVYAAMHQAAPQLMPTVTVSLVPMQQPKPTAAPVLHEPRPVVEKPMAKPQPKTVPTSPFGKSPKKGSEVPAPTPHVAPATSTAPAIDVPIGTAGVTSIEGDFPYTIYIQNMNRLIGQHWARPEVKGGTSVIIYFAVDRDGSIRDARIETPSGNSFYDRAAYRAVLETSPLPPLPFAYSGTFLGVHLTFK